MLWRHLMLIAEALGDRRCWFHRGAFHFALDAEGERTLAISGDAASRVRIDTCFRGAVRGTRWAREDDDARLALIVLEARDEAAVA